MPARTNQIEWVRDSHNVLIEVMPEGMSMEEYVRSIQSDAHTHKPVINKTQDSTVILYQSESLGPGDKKSSTSDP